MNIGGDGKDVWPFAGSISPGGSSGNDNFHYDIQKLHQWNIVFEHAQTRGIMLHLVLNEAESQNKRELDNGELGTERKLYYRELVARFGHNLALQWNVCEEYNLDFDLGADRIKAFAGYIQNIDPYEHPIAVHNTGGPTASFSPFWGDSRLHMTSVQASSNGIGNLIENFRESSANAGRPLPICIDECDRLLTDDNNSHGGTWPYPSGAIWQRRHILWPVLLSGGQIEYIMEDMLCTENFSDYAPMWRYTWYARKFLEENVNFWNMVPADNLLSGGSNGQVLAEAGEAYAIYLPNGSDDWSIDLSAASGECTVAWFNPRTGIFEGDESTVNGGGTVSLGSPPSDIYHDWAVLVKTIGYSVASKQCDEQHAPEEFSADGMQNIIQQALPGSYLKMYTPAGRLIKQFTVTKNLLYQNTQSQLNNGVYIAVFESSKQSRIAKKIRLSR